MATSRSSGSGKRPVRRAGRSSSSAKLTKAGFGNYQTALRWLFDRTNVERLRPTRVDQSVFKLDRMRKLLEAIGNPEKDLRIVHVAGTNGKGSVVAMTASCLRSAGYAVGVYTSPHLVDIRERVQINDQMISHASFSEHLHRVGMASQNLPSDLGEATFFELMTAMALLYFAEEAVDAVVLETGLGGRLDATNAVTPDVTAITKIDFDHRVFLGETLEEIAAEKAGIFKPGVPALTIAQTPEVIEVFRKKAEEVGCTLEVLGQEIEFSSRFEANQQLGPHMRIGLTTDRSNFEHVPVPLPGEHQAQNCGLALAILDKLGAGGFELPEMRVLEGLESTVVPARMEIVRGERHRVLLDGAHNPSALGALVKAIGAHVPYDSLIMIFGCAADKDVDSLLEQVSLSGDKVVFTKSKGNPRAADPHDLARRFESKYPKMYQIADTLEEALVIAEQAAGRDDLVVVTGSFYLVGEAKKYLRQQADRAAAAAK